MEINEAVALTELIKTNYFERVGRKFTLEIEQFYIRILESMEFEIAYEALHEYMLQSPYAPSYGDLWVFYTLKKLGLPSPHEAWNMCIRALKKCSWERNIPPEVEEAVKVLGGWEYLHHCIHFEGKPTSFFHKNFLNSYEALLKRKALEQSKATPLTGELAMAHEAAVKSLPDPREKEKLR